ncbi:hypothetical protein Pgy4_38296, partial [Pseudomonas savastanoi pv. glycinea str. race 4]
IRLVRRGWGRVGRQKQTLESTKGSLGSPSRYVSMLFFVFGWPVVVFCDL